MPKNRDDQLAAPSLSNITVEQAHELRNEISRLNAELYQAKTELRRTHIEFDEKQRHFDRESPMPNYVSSMRESMRLLKP
jgi:hypothetical protein